MLFTGRTVAVAWAFMLSLLVGASYEMLGELAGPPDQNDWLSEGVFLAIVLTMTVIAGCGLVSRLNTSTSPHCRYDPRQLDWHGRERILPSRRPAASDRS